MNIYIFYTFFRFLCYNKTTFPGSSMVEQEAVNFEVTGSSPVRGANQNNVQKNPFYQMDFLVHTPVFRLLKSSSEIKN